MGYSVFPAVESSSASSYMSVPTANTYHFILKNYAAGVYRLRAYATSSQATPTLVVTFVDASNATIQVVTTVDPNSADSYNYSEAIFTLTSDAVKLLLNSNQITYFTMEPLAVTAPTPFVITKYTTSQTINLTQTSACILIGGGGGGTTSGSGGGGGSGYMQKFSLAAGTYTLALGSGGATGATGATGGASTISTYTANGGVGGTGNGAAGGSGGGGGGDGGGGNNGGSNGGNGNGGPQGSAGGTGSGVTVPYWQGAGAGGAYNTTREGGGNGAGGTYGGGAGINNGGGGGGSAAAGTGGGGSAGGGAGGRGCLIVCVGA